MNRRLLVTLLVVAACFVFGQTGPRANPNTSDSEILAKQIFRLEREVADLNFRLKRIENGNDLRITPLQITPLQNSRPQITAPGTRPVSPDTNPR